ETCNASFSAARASCGVNPTAFNFNKRFQTPERARAHSPATNRNSGAGMIFRAIFWIGLVAFLMPHEPDLGFGRPGASPHATGTAFHAADIQKACASRDTACASGLALFNSFQAVAGRS